MKKILIASIIGILIYSCASSENGNLKTRYFDEKYQKITKSKFNRIRSTNKLLDIPGDSINHKKLTLRENRGYLNDRKSLELLLESITNRDLDSKKPIVVIYFPATEDCISNVPTDLVRYKSYYDQIEDGLDQIAKIKPIYIHKNSNFPKKYDKVLNIYKDPDETIERLFFEYFYPCNSFVVISKDGNYISYFGEFKKEYIWEATQILSIE